MTIADNIKLDFLWKKVIYGVTQTAFSGNTSGTTKQGPNESLPSNAIVYNSQIWSLSDNIPISPPSTNTDIVDVRIGATALQCVADPSVTGSRTWIVVSNPSNSINDTNRLKDWITPTINSAYLVKVYAGTPSSANLLNSMLTNYEYVFDYSSGVIYFPNNVPNNVLSNGIYIEGYRYIGPKGGITNVQNVGQNETAGSGGGVAGIYRDSTAGILNFRSLVAGTGIKLTQKDDYIQIDSDGVFLTPIPTGVEDRNLTYTTKMLNPGEQELFTMNTCGVAIVELACLDSDATVECHTTSQYNDTNPYTFVAYDGHLCDDGTTYGSSLQGIIRGPRFFRIHNMENFHAAYTFWRILNSSNVPKTITLALRTLTFGF